jgi:thiamine kinase-like enzyme
MPLEEALAAARRWVPGGGGIEIERLASGLVNESFRVTRGGRSYSLRLPAENAVGLGLDHEWECRVLECAGAAGMAPRVEHCDPLLGTLVMHWVPGTSWTRDVALQPANIERVAGLARQVHTLDLAAPVRGLGPADWIARYSEALAGPSAGAKLRADGAWTQDRLAGLGRTATSHLAAFGALPQAAPALCHSDLHLGNLLQAECGLILLDWEYAHASDPFWDLAGWACNTDMGENSRALLLRAYLGRTPVPAESHRLHILAWLYDYVCVLWSLVYLAERSGGESAPSVARRAERVATRLESDAGGPAG